MGARAIKRVLKNNPFSLLQTQAKKQLTNPASDARPKKIRHAPWVYAVSLFPPAPAPLPYVVPSEVGQFSLPGSIETISKKQENSVNSSKRIKPSNLRIHHSKKAPMIQYPEDALRKEFYATHPFELNRPVTVAETEESLLASSRDTVDGESVVRKTMELINKDGGAHPLHIAYNIALAEFYKKRAGEELAFEQKIAAEKGRLEKLAQNQGADSTEKLEVTEPRDVTWFRNREEEEIARNVKFLDDMVAE
ncbi:mitochondrial ribosomal small subunit component [Dinochytrium kinnereticum]|nr:mitochondrial ribosomal small subunit component [Dinochytrium kinnereticum]